MGEFRYLPDSRATTQFAFAYERLVDGKLRRFLRLCTTQQKIVRQAREVVDSLELRTVLTLLTHKLIRASAKEGLVEGQLLLQDWLVILMAQYSQSGTRGQKVSTEPLNGMQIPRHVYALLASPILANRVNPDRRVYIQHLYSMLSPPLLVRALYPKLTSFTSFEKQEHEQLYLSRKAIQYGAPADSSFDRIYILDTLLEILVLCTATEERTDVEFPPQHDCLVKKTIASLRTGRPVAPMLTWVRMGSDMMSQFESHLLEEADISGIGYENFLKYIQDEVKQFLGG